MFRSHRMSSTTACPCDDVAGFDTTLGKPDDDAPYFLNRPADQIRCLVGVLFGGASLARMGHRHRRDARPRGIDPAPRKIAAPKSHRVLAHPKGLRCKLLKAVRAYRSEGDGWRGSEHEFGVQRQAFAPDIILLCTRWYCRYALSYRDLKEMMAERFIGAPHHRLPLGPALSQ